MNDRSMPAPSEPASSRPGPDDPDALPRGPSGEVVTVTCAVDHAEALTDLAWAMGASGVAELPDGGPPDSVRLVVGATDRGTAAGIAATFAADTRCRGVALAAADHAWADTWRAHATAQRAGPFGIRLPDHPPADAPFDIVVEPGTTFGYGHTTTLLALEALATVDRRPGRVLDIGTGSGALAIAASLLGADEVTAVDIDPDAVAACRANAARNGAVVTATCADACNEPVASPPEGYDLVIVNVTAAIQMALAEVVASVTGPEAIRVVSGILAHQEPAVVAAHAPAAVIDRRARDGWVALVLAHRDLRNRPGPGPARKSSDPPGP